MVKTQQRRKHMKKRLRKKLEKQAALLEFSHMIQYCDDCGAKMIVKDCDMIVEEEFLGKFTLHGYHPVCPNGCEELYTTRMANDERRMIEARIQHFLLKNYPPEKYEYIGINEMAELENVSITELLERDLYLPVFYIVRNHERLYLRKSYDLYKTSAITYHAGWFDITIPSGAENGEDEKENSKKIGKQAVSY